MFCSMSYIYGYLSFEHVGFVETLSKDGKQIEALCFSHYFGIMDKIHPGAMLKSYMKEARKAAQETPKNSANPKVCFDITINEVY